MITMKVISAIFALFLPPTVSSFAVTLNPHKSPPLTQRIHFINAASTEHLRGPFLDTKPCFGWTFDVQKHVVLSVCNPTWLSSIQFISFPAFHHHICSTSWCS
eukprot:749403_1